MKTVLKNVRLSFPAIFKKSVYKGVEGKYEATFLLDKEKDGAFINDLKGQLTDFLLDNGIKKQATQNKFINSVIKDGDDKDYDGYENVFFIKGRSAQRIATVDRDKSPLTEDDEKLYAGCMVNAVIRFYLTKDKDMLCVGLSAIQFSEHGEAFGASNASDAELFDNLEDEF